MGILGAAFGAYVFALFYYARTTFFWTDIAPFPVNWTEQSIISESCFAGPFMWAACLVWAAFAAWREHGRLRLFALTFLLFVAVQQAIVQALQLGNFAWGGPPIAYIDMFTLPFYALFGAYLLVGWWAEYPGRARWLALVILPWGSVLALHRPFSILTLHQENPFHFNHAPVAERDRADGRKSVSRTRRQYCGYRVRAAVCLGPFLSQHAYDGTVSFYTGNDHRSFGLWYFGIPTLIAGNQFSSPFFHVINSRLLSSATQKHVRGLTTVTRFEPRILAMLGVRFVITSRPLPGYTLKNTLRPRSCFPDRCARSCSIAMRLGILVAGCVTSTMRAA